MNGHIGKNTVIRIPGATDTVVYRTLHHKNDNTSKFVIKTSNGNVFEHPLPKIEPGNRIETFDVPGDFVIDEGFDYIRLVAMRTMPFENYIREESIYIALPENPK